MTRIMNSAQVVNVQLNPTQDLVRTGQLIIIQYVQIVYNFTEGYVSCELKGRALDDQKQLIGPLRSIQYRDRREFPKWLVDLVGKYMPMGFKEDRNSPVAKSATKGLVAEQNRQARHAARAPRRAKVSHPDIITE